jgi:hypothetical protein
MILSTLLVWVQRWPPDEFAVKHRCGRIRIASSRSPICYRSRSPRGQRPRERAMLLAVQVSSTNTRRAGSRSGWASNPPPAPPSRPAAPARQREAAFLYVRSRVSRKLRCVPIPIVRQRSAKRRARTSPRASPSSTSPHWSLGTPRIVRTASAAASCYGSIERLSDSDTPFVAATVSVPSPFKGLQAVLSVQTTTPSACTKYPSRDRES